MASTMTRRSSAWLLPAVLIVAVVARLWDVGQGLPYVTDPDEPNNLIRTLEMLERGDGNPAWFHYPSALFYLYGGVLAVIGASRGLGVIMPPELIAGGTGLYPEVWAILAPRLMTVAVSVATVAVVFITVHKATGRRWAAGFAGLLLALSPLAVSQGKVFAPDSLSALFAALGIWASYRIYERGRPVDYAVAGAAVGLAAGSKYNAALIGVAVVVAHLLRSRRGHPVIARGVLRAIYTSVGVFLLTTPFAVFDYPTFLGDVGFELVHYSTGHTGAVGGILVYLAAISTSFSVAILLIIAGLRDIELRHHTAIAASFAVSYTIFISLFPTTFERNLLPALPAYAVAIGIGSVAMRRVRWLGAATAARVTIVLMAGAITIGVAGLAVDYTKVVDRGPAREWISGALPVGSAVVVERGSPWVDPERYEVKRAEFAILDSLPPDWDFVLLATAGSGRFLDHPDLYPSEVEAWEVLTGSTCLVRVFPGVVEIRAPDCSYQLDEPS